jgi:hypothetical protein
MGSRTRNEPCCGPSGAPDWHGWPNVRLLDR